MSYISLIKIHVTRVMMRSGNVRIRRRVHPHYNNIITRALHNSICLHPTVET